MRFLQLLVGLLIVTVSIAQKWYDGIELVGRIHPTSSNTLQGDWSNSGIRFQVEAISNSVSIDLSLTGCTGSCNYYVSISVNCGTVAKYQVNPYNTHLLHNFATVPGQKYEIQYHKVTEASCSDAEGIMEMKNLEIDGGKILRVKSEWTSFCPREFSMLAFGDSITVAYGIDGYSPCPFSAYTQDVTHSYINLIAESIQSELHVVGWSGKGVVRNYGDPNPTSTNPLPTYYNRTLGNLNTPDENTNYWSPESYQPDLVTIMLGSNDYSTQPNPSDEQFTTGLINFITQIQSDYPKAKILALCSPAADIENQWENIENAAKATNSYFYRVTNDVYSGGYGCDGHPYATTHKNIANQIIPVVKSILGIQK